ncbi:MAG: hypothetical protein QW270_04545 [Candidatus Bathyarchaeia archaeon]
MLSVIDILAEIEEQKIHDIKKLARNLNIQIDQLKQILTDLKKHNLVKYDSLTGRVNLPVWLVNINKKTEAIKPAVGAIILPKYQEVNIQDVTIGNFTENDIELKVRFKGKRKEIAICTMG